MPIRREVSLGGSFGDGSSFRMSLSFFPDSPTTSLYGMTLFLYANS